MADVRQAASVDGKKEERRETQSLEIIFSAALGAVASLLKDPAQRSIAAAVAAPLGYVLAKTGRWTITYWVPKWMAPKSETVESRTKRYIKDVRRELKNKQLTAAEREQKVLHIQQLEDALHQHRLRELQAVPSAIIPPIS